MVRSAVVSGQFYPAREEALLESMHVLVPGQPAQKPSIGVMSPHAGYMYSGAVAGKTLADVNVTRDVVILGPNHHGRGHRAAVYASGQWETPLGHCAIASDLAEQILAGCPISAADEEAHLYEHSLEVQLPFIQYLSPESRIVPICISHLSLDLLLEFGDGLARALQTCQETPLIVASTDMTHYESGDVARKKDFLALDMVLNLDPSGLYDVVTRNRISMCGVMPTVVMLQAAKSLGATQAELVAYSNSGDVTGDQSDVVGYAGVRVF